jgi:hypothetical protein
MTPEKLAKIQRLAEDPRGDPATRAIAQAALKRYAPPPRFKDVQEEGPRRNFQHPGLKTSAQYDRYRFMDRATWKVTTNQNPTILVSHKGEPYRIVLFAHKKTPTFGWMRVHMLTDVTEFSGKFKTLAEAHEAAWISLTRL